MVEEREYEGTDLEDALRAASTDMGVPEVDLHYEIVEQGRRGVFGLGAKSVRIRIMPPVDGMTDHEVLKETNDEPTTPAKAPVVARQDGEEVREALQRMLGLMGLDLEVGAGSDDGGLTLEISGKDRRLLMKKDAELLSALQLLLNRMSRRAWPNVGRIHLACEGDRRRRDDDLVELAREVAQQVSRTGRTKKLHPMNAYERRLVHITVREFGGLSSSSDGQGSLKSVRISKIKNSLEAPR